MEQWSSPNRRRDKHTGIFSLFLEQFDTTARWTYIMTLCTFSKPNQAWVCCCCRADVNDTPADELLFAHSRPLWAEFRGGLHSAYWILTSFSRSTFPILSTTRKQAYGHIQHIRNGFIWISPCSGASTNQSKSHAEEEMQQTTFSVFRSRHCTLFSSHRCTKNKSSSMFVILHVACLMLSKCRLW